jgi:hypothetical protein
MSAEINQDIDLGLPLVIAPDRKPISLKSTSVMQLYKLGDQKRVGVMAKIS